MLNRSYLGQKVWATWGNLRIFFHAAHNFGHFVNVLTGCLKKFGSLRIVMVLDHFGQIT
jgi:hypothetical protein